MIPAVIVLAVAALVGSGVLMRRVNSRDDARSAYLDANRVYLVQDGQRPVWGVQPIEASDEQPVPAGNPAPSVSVWAHSVPTLNEEATDAAA